MVNKFKLCVRAEHLVCVFVTWECVRLLVHPCMWVRCHMLGCMGVSFCAACLCVCIISVVVL